MYERLQPLMRSPVFLLLSGSGLEMGGKEGRK